VRKEKNARPVPEIVLLVPVVVLALGRLGSFDDEDDDEDGLAQPCRVRFSSGFN